MKKRLPEVRETLIMWACLQYLGLRGIFAYRANSGGMKVEDESRKRGYRYVQFASAPGLSDIVGILPGGRALYVEVKSAKGVATKAQRDFLAEVERFNGLALVVRSPEELAAKIREALR